MEDGLAPNRPDDGKACDTTPLTPRHFRSRLPLRRASGMHASSCATVSSAHWSPFAPSTRDAAQHPSHGRGASPPPSWLCAHLDGRLSAGISPRAGLPSNCRHCGRALVTPWPSWPTPSATTSSPSTPSANATRGRSSGLTSLRAKRPAILRRFLSRLKIRSAATHPSVQRRAALAIEPRLFDSQAASILAVAERELLTLGLRTSPASHGLPRRYRGGVTERDAAHHSARCAVSPRFLRPSRGPPQTARCRLAKV